MVKTSSVHVGGSVKQLFRITWRSLQMHDNQADFAANDKFFVIVWANKERNWKKSLAFTEQGIYTVSFSRRLFPAGILCAKAVKVGKVNGGGAWNIPPLHKYP